jgi:hypothetical protein
VLLQDLEVAWPMTNWFLSLLNKWLLQSGLHKLSWWSNELGVGSTYVIVLFRIADLIQRKIELGILIADVFLVQHLRLPAFLGFNFSLWEWLLQVILSQHLLLSKLFPFEAGLSFLLVLGWFDLDLQRHLVAAQLLLLIESVATVELLLLRLNDSLRLLEDLHLLLGCLLDEVLVVLLVELLLLHLCDALVYSLLQNLHVWLAIILGLMKLLLLRLHHVLGHVALHNLIQLMVHRLKVAVDVCTRVFVFDFVHCLEFLKNLECVRHVEGWVQHRHVSDLRCVLHCRVLLDDRDANLGFLVFAVDFDNPVVSHNCLTALVTLLVQNSKVEPDFAIVRLQVLRFQNRVESLLVLALVIKKDSIRDQEAGLTSCLLNCIDEALCSFREVVQSKQASGFDVKRVGIILLTLIGFGDKV